MSTYISKLKVLLMFRISLYIEILLIVSYALLWHGPREPTILYVNGSRDGGVAALLLLTPLWIFLLILEIGSINYLFIKFRQNPLKACFLLAVKLAIWLIILFFPIFEFSLTIDFYQKLAERQQIVSWVKSGELKPSYLDIVLDDNLLPPRNRINFGDISLQYTDIQDRYKDTSLEGEIVVFKETNKTQILFITQLFADIQSDKIAGRYEYSGFIYSSNNEYPSFNDFILYWEKRRNFWEHKDFSRIKKLKDNWFWVSTGNINKIMSEYLTQIGYTL